MRLVFTERAKRDWEKLDRAIQNQLRKKLAFYFRSDDPSQYGEKLKNSRWGDYRFRIGDYRMMFDIKGDVCIILRVGHRRDVYRN